jgi:hypothetical protein
MPAGAPARSVEQAADVLLDRLAPVPAHAGRVERVGGGERRHTLELLERAPTRVHTDERLLERLLAARGMVPERDQGRVRMRGDDVGLGLG